MTLWVGTSGWQYRDWRGTFYPEKLPQARWLEHFADRFATVEVNNAFYRLPTPENFRSWAERTPGDFVVAVKASRYITHIKRLKDAAESAGRFLEHARYLGDKLGPVLLQLPPNLNAVADALAEVLDVLAGVRVAVEFRHDSWFDDKTYALLAEHDVALCLADRDSRPVTPLERTAGWGYVRLHAGGASPQPCYGRGALESWARRIAELWDSADDVYVYFNNDTRGCALRDARWFAAAAARAGLEPSRVPGAREITVR